MHGLLAFCIYFSIYMEMRAGINLLLLLVLPVSTDFTGLTENGKTGRFFG
jgi:hypothetical protein